jgi:cyclopropane fatty-acyl-phospholipid synthase-like methyltransferase
MEDIYKNIPPGLIPWNRVSPPELLLKFLESGRIQPCKTLEIGCGMGNYAIYLSRHGFDVTGIDVSPTAIGYAVENAKKAEVACKFILADFLTVRKEMGCNYRFVYDWEVLHHVFPENRKDYVRKVASALAPDGNYFSVCFNEQDPNFGGAGKFRSTPIGTRLYFSSIEELKELYDPYFRIMELKTVEIEGKQLNHVACQAVLQKK